MKSSLSILVLTIALALGALGAYAKWYAVIAAKSARVAELEHNIASKSRTIERAVATRATLLENKEHTDRLLAYSVAQEEVVPFISVLEGLALARGTKLEVLSVSLEGPKEREVLVIALKVDGSFDAVLRTLGAIEYAPYAISFSNAGFSRADVAGGWHAEVRLRVTAR
jgi:hypothetical protein